MTLTELAKQFIYKGDGAKDTWRILKPDDLVGDCDDYALTALFILCGKDMNTFWEALESKKAAICFYTLPSGAGHAVLRWDGKYIDNNYRDWFTPPKTWKYGYDFTVSRIREKMGLPKPTVPVQPKAPEKASKKGSEGIVLAVVIAALVALAVL
jgi:hypothetical protein